MKRRKPNSGIQCNLRIKEELRSQIWAAAKDHQVSFQQEVRTRLEDSLEAKARQSLADTAADMERSWQRCGAAGPDPRQCRASRRDRLQDQRCPGGMKQPPIRYRNSI
jgi:hypothetical protein